MSHETDDPAHLKTPKGRYLYLLALGALGVVYGDIGTSPLYAFRESLGEQYGLVPAPGNVLGILSLIFWSLIIVITIKYVSFVTRADNHGEGGILALTSLVTPLQVKRGGGRWLLVILGLFGASLLYGDGMITPAISVLSAVEGLSVATPLFDPYILPITIGILVALFATQRFWDRQCRPGIRPDYDLVVFYARRLGSDADCAAARCTRRDQSFLRLSLFRAQRRSRVFLCWARFF